MNKKTKQCAYLFIFTSLIVTTFFYGKIKFENQINISTNSIIIPSEERITKWLKEKSPSFKEEAKKGKYGIRTIARHSFNPLVDLYLNDQAIIDDKIGLPVFYSKLKNEKNQTSMDPYNKLGEDIINTIFWRKYSDTKIKALKKRKEKVINTDKFDEGDILEIENQMGRTGYYIFGQITFDKKVAPKDNNTIYGAFSYAKTGPNFFHRWFQKCNDLPTKTLKDLCEKRHQIYAQTNRNEEKRENPKGLEKKILDFWKIKKYDHPKYIRFEIPNQYYNWNHPTIDNKNKLKVNNAIREIVIYKISPKTKENYKEESKKELKDIEETLISKKTTIAEFNKLINRICDKYNTKLVFSQEQEKQKNIAKIDKMLENNPWLIERISKNIKKKIEKICPELLERNSFKKSKTK